MRTRIPVDDDARRAWEEPLSREEVDRWLATPPSDADIAETLDLVRWFTSRYPTVRERFAYVRRRYGEIATAEARRR